MGFSMFHSGFGYGFGCFDDRIDRSGFAEKSAAAQRREDAAKAKPSEEQRQWRREGEGVWNPRKGDGEEEWTRR